ncbi:DUF4918 family protein [bacterium]|nr:DUF4918 family protein [bacterium]
MATFAEQILQFYETLNPPDVPASAGVLDPYSTPEVQRVMRQFFTRYFNDIHTRIFLIGINPGRFGSGITGIGFTDPLALSEDCGIKHTLGTGTELSARFVYQLIRRMGGPESFYRHVYITALSPYGFVRNGKNLNFYDDPDLESAVTPFIEATLREQISFGAKPRAIIVGTGKNFKRAQAINQRLGLFDELVPLAHPRYIMQYKRKQLDAYLDEYVSTLSQL